MDNPGHFKSEFVINNLAADQREFLMKKDIRTEISRSAGVHISIRGRYVKPKSDGSLLCESNTRPLHLLITGSTKHNLTLAMKKIQEVLRFSTWSEATDEEVPEAVIALEEKITVGIEVWPSVFGMKAKILGENYENINYIKKETNATIALRGKGIGLVVDDEADEPLHVLVQYGDPKTKDKARQLIFNLIETVQKEFIERFAKYYTPPKKPDIISVQHVRRPRKKSSSPDDKSYSNNKRAKMLPSPKPPSPTLPPQTEESRNFVGKKDIDKITVGIDSVPLDFNLKSKIYGQALMNVKHIEKTTGALLLLQGRGCGTGGGDKLESDVAPYLIVKYKKPELKEAARNLIFNLIETVQQEYIAQYETYLAKPKKPQIVPFDASSIEKKPTQSTASSTKLNFLKPPSESSNESSKQSPYTKQPLESDTSLRSSQLATTIKRPSYAGRSPEANLSSRTSLPIASNPVIVPPPPPVISKPLPPIIPKPIPYTLDEIPNAVPTVNSSSSSRQSVPESITSLLANIGAQSSTYGIPANAVFPTQKSHLPTQPVPSHSASQNRNLQYLKKKSPPPELPVESSYPECKKFCNSPFANPSNMDPSGNLPVQREQNVPKQKSVKTTRCLVPLTPYTKPVHSATPTTVVTTSLNGAKTATSSLFHWKPTSNLKRSITSAFTSGTESDSTFFKHYNSAISDSDDNKSLICIDSEDEFGDCSDLAQTLSKMPRVRSIAVQTDDNVWLKKKQIQCLCGRFTHFQTGVRSLGVQTEVYRF